MRDVFSRIARGTFEFLTLRRVTARALMFAAFFCAVMNGWAAFRAKRDLAASFPHRVPNLRAQNLYFGQIALDDYILAKSAGVETVAIGDCFTMGAGQKTPYTWDLSQRLGKPVLNLAYPMASPSAKLFMYRRLKALNPGRKFDVIFQVFSEEIVGQENEELYPRPLPQDPAWIERASFWSDGLGGETRKLFEVDLGRVAQVNLLGSIAPAFRYSYLRLPTRWALDAGQDSETPPDFQGYPNIWANYYAHTIRGDRVGAVDDFVRRSRYTAPLVYLAWLIRHNGDRAIFFVSPHSHLFREFPERPLWDRISAELGTQLRAQGAAYADWSYVFPSEDELMDPVHANRRGARIVAGRVEALMKEAGWR